MSLPNIKEYRLIAKNHYEDLERVVNELISKGWEPVGGICVDFVVL